MKIFNLFFSGDESIDEIYRDVIVSILSIYIYDEEAIGLLRLKFLFTVNRILYM